MPSEWCVCFLRLPERHLSCIDHKGCNSLGHFKCEDGWQALLSYGVNKAKSIDAAPPQSDVDPLINGRT